MPPIDTTTAASAPADDVRSAMPSLTDLAHGAAPAVWGPDPSDVPPEARSMPESAADFSLLRAAEGLGLPAATIQGAREWLAGEVTFTPAQLTEFDAIHKDQAITTLRNQWGDEAFDRNIDTINRYLDSLPGDAGLVFRNVRDGTGRALANDPASLQRVLGAAKGRGSFDLPAGDAHAQIAAIQQHMRTNREAYNKDEMLQATYRQLLVQTGAA